jgi:hypothetical protein
MALWKKIEKTSRTLNSERGFNFSAESWKTSKFYTSAHTLLDIPWDSTQL